MRSSTTIVAAEKELPNKHLISLNIANGSKKIEKPHPAVSVFNFHYASPPTAVAENYHLNKVIGDNETGFKGTADDHYRMEAWEFMLAGGGFVQQPGLFIRRRTRGRNVSVSGKATGRRQPWIPPADESAQGVYRRRLISCG